MGLVTTCDRCGAQSGAFADYDKQPCRGCLEKEIERLQVWKGLAFNLWHLLYPHTTDDIARRAIVSFMLAVDTQIEKEQAAEAAKET